MFEYVTFRQAKIKLNTLSLPQSDRLQTSTSSHAHKHIYVQDQWLCFSNILYLNTCNYSISHYLHNFQDHTNSAHNRFIFYGFIKQQQICKLWDVGELNYENFICDIVQVTSSGI